MIAIYKPNPKNSGHACSFQYGQDGNFYFNFVKQESWDAGSKTGRFSKDQRQKMSGKLSLTEVCKIIDSIESNREFSTFHTSANQTLSIKFAPYMRDGQQMGFGFAVTKKTKDGGDQKFVISLDFGEAVHVREFFKTAIGVSIKTAIESRFEGSAAE